MTNFKNFRNFTAGILGIAILSLGLYSCNNDESVINNDETVFSKSINSLNEELRNINFEQIGILHNEGLDYIYDKILLSPSVLNENDNVVNQFIFDKTEEYLQDTEYFNGFDTGILPLIRFGNTYATSEDLILFLENEITNNLLSTEANDYLVDINNIYDSYASIEGYSSINAINSLRIIEQSVQNNSTITTNEYAILRSVIVTGIYSLQYWEDNMSKWESLNITYSTTSSKGDWQWFKGAIKNMAVADAYGAGVGLVVGGISSIWSGPGILIGAAAGAVGYGLNASGVTGVRELVKSYQ